VLGRERRKSQKEAATLERRECYKDKPNRIDKHNCKMRERREEKISGWRDRQRKEICK